MDTYAHNMLRQIYAAVQSTNKQIAALSAALTKQGAQTMATLDAIHTAVTNETTVEDSAITLLQQLAAALSAIASKPVVDPAEVQALADQITANAGKLADAVTANTPAAA